jgi:hypothetical protein
MAVLRRSYSAKDGLGVEVRVSTPLVHIARERLEVRLVSGVDLPTLERADQRKAPPTLGITEASCGAVFPEDGALGRTRLPVVGNLAESLELGADALPLRTGGWWTLRVQLFLDGRCGVAVNQRVLWISPVPVRLDGEYRLWLGNEALDSKILHGPLQFWTGVRTDIDWSRKP